MGSKGSQSTQTSSTTAPNPQAMDAYSSLLNQAQTTAATPYQAYSGELTAPINSQQQTGVGGVNNYANWASPYETQAAGVAGGLTSGVTPGQIQSFMSPYTQNVVDATQNQFNNQNAIAQSGLQGNEIAQGALGGNRNAVAAANLAQNQQIAQAPVIANLENTGYQSAVNTALANNQQQLGAAQGLAGIGAQGQSSGISGATSQIGAGTLEQQTQQAQDTARLNQFMQQQAYPFQTEQWLAGMDTGVGSQMGGTSTGTSTPPAPNIWNQILGLGATAAGAYMSSDRRLKENIKHIGKLNNGHHIYRFNYKGDPQTRIGLMAQDVEKTQTEAVREIGGFSAVDYDAATKDAIKRARGGVAHFDTGGVVAPASIGGTPYAGVAGYVPTMSITPGHGAPQAQIPGQGQQNSDLQKQVSDTASIAKGLTQAMKSPANAPMGILPSAAQFTPTANGTTFADGVSSPAVADASLGDYGLYARGGVAAFADGGTVNTQTSGWGNMPTDAPLPIDRDGADYLVNHGLASGSTMGDAPGSLTLPSPSELGNYKARKAPRRGFGGVVASFADGGVADDGPDDPSAPPWDVTSLGLGQPWSPTNDAITSDIDVGADPSQPSPPNQKPSQPTPPAIVAKAAGVAPPTPAASMAFSGDTSDTSDSLPSEVALGYSDHAKGVVPSASAPSADTSDASSSDKHWWNNPEIGQSLMSAGLGMMSSRSPNLGVAIGEGGHQGLATYGGLQKQDLEAKKNAQDLAQKAQDFKLRQSTQQEVSRHNQATENASKYTPIGTVEVQNEDGSTALHPVMGDINNGTAIDTITGKPPVGKFAPKTTGSTRAAPSPEDADALATYYVTTGDKSRLGGFGNNGDARVAINHAIAKVQKDLGISDQELAQRAVDYEGRKTGARTLSVQEVKMGTAAMEAEGAIHLTRGLIERLPRTSFEPLNQLAQDFAKKTLNPDQTELYTRTQGVINAYAAVMARGANVTTDSARTRAEELLNTAGDPDTYNRTLDTMLSEINMAKASPERMRQFYRQQFGAKSVEDDTSAPMGTNGPPVTAPMNPSNRDVGRVYTTPKGPLKWTGTGWAQP